MLDKKESHIPDLGRKSDLRYAKAEASIRDAFIHLLEQHDFRDVTTSMIVRAAQINRSTFYTHYHDKYELLDAVKKDLIEDLEAITQASSVGLITYGAGSEGTLHAYFSTIADYLDEYGGVLFTLLDQGDRTFSSNFRNVVADILAQSSEKYTLAMPANLASAGLAGIMVYMAGEWVRSGCPDKEGFVDLLVALSRKLPALFFEDA